MNPLAKELNEIILNANPHIYDMLSDTGKNLYFPKGILTQSAEAKEKADKYNATVGMATEKGQTMHLPSIMNKICGLAPEESLTYAPSFGIMPLRKAWKEAMMKKNPSLNDKVISLPVVTNAITHGLRVIADLWVDEGDAIILPDKIWGNYNMIFETLGTGRICKYQMFDKDGGFNVPALKKCIQTESIKNSKAIVLLNFPNNPTGYSITKEEGAEIAVLLTGLANDGLNIIAVTDDAYFGLFYEDEVLKESIFAQMTGKEPRLLTIKLDGATKEDYVWGLRVGFITYGASIEGNASLVYDALERKTAGCVRGSISSVSHLSQSIVLRSLESDSYIAEKAEKFGIMKRRALELKQVLLDPKYDDAWEVYPFNSGYFMCIKLKYVNAEHLRVHLLDKYGTGLIAIGDTDLRIAFSCIEEDDIRQLFDTILAGAKELRI
ncbi:MAG: aminotransferase class I/II-fold pyridoxal phosphate-dependent enzyme [Deltaproteobacteria bacterium]|nr:aminotransferase class I/II-fold pyridoxal phosphate-dependent enzyme [Deltaproteobacteria bacterium]